MMMADQTCCSRSWPLIPTTLCYQADLFCLNEKAIKFAKFSLPPKKNIGKLAGLVTRLLISYIMISVIGGHVDLDVTSPKAAITTMFEGCIHKVAINMRTINPTCLTRLKFCVFNIVFIM